jgi:hypothetical protein
MKMAMAALIIALTATLVVLATSSRGQTSSAQCAELTADRPSTPLAGPNVPPLPAQGDRPVEPQIGSRTPQSLPASENAPDASEIPAAPPPPPVPRALHQLVMQSRQENEQLAELRQQLAAEELRRQDQTAQEAAQHAATLEALDTLRRVEASLATGDSDGVDEQLVQAEAALSGRTRLDVEAAREALGRSDLFPAREYLAAALAENRVRR